MLYKFYFMQMYNIISKKLSDPILEKKCEKITKKRLLDQVSAYDTYLADSISNQWDGWWDEGMRFGYKWMCTLYRQVTHN